MILHTDVETGSELDLREVGLDRYITHPSTRLLMNAYCFDDGPIKLWQPHRELMPQDLIRGLEEPSVTVAGWNCAFERNVYKWLLNIEIPIRRFKDVMIQARYLAFPGYLEDVGKVLKMPLDEQKIADGERLKKLFCEPRHKGGMETLFGISEPVYRDWSTDPRDWELFCQYCIGDVRSERAIMERMKSFPLPESEHEIWCLDQEINDRGIAVDQTLVNGGAYVASTVKTELLARLSTLTGLAKPNSPKKVLSWLRTQGYEFHSIGKAYCMRALAGECKLTPEGIEALTLRQQTSKTAATKLVSIKDQLSSDGRLRNQLNFMGASRTGRWSSGSGE